MGEPGAARCRPWPRTSAGGEFRLLPCSVLFLLLLPLVFGNGSLHPHRGEVLVLRAEQWRLCGSVALDPEDSKWSCCRDVYPFYRPTQRCCQTLGIFVIPKDCKKSEAEDCGTYTQETLGMHLLTSKEPRETCNQESNGQQQLDQA